VKEKEAAIIQQPLFYKNGTLPRSAQQRTNPSTEPRKKSGQAVATKAKCLLKSRYNKSFLPYQSFNQAYIH